MTPSSPDAARAMIARVRTIEALLQDEPFLTQTEWLLLPAAKQETVLRRLLALREYDTLPSPTSVDALRAAKAAGVAIVRFYQLVSHWRAHDRSPFALVPYQSLGMERPTRLAAEETAGAIAKSIAAFLRSDPLASTGLVISHVRRTWKGPGELPTDTALRAFHERAIRSGRPAPGTLTLSVPGRPQEDDVVAERLAETLVIDHVAIKGLVAEEDWLQPTVTLAIDLWSGAPLGAAAMAGPPGPDGLILALRDVARRIDRGAPTDAGRGEQPATKPRLVIATTFARRWAGLVAALLAAGHEVVERRDAFLQQGGPARRLLGMRLGPLRLERRADRRDQFDVQTTAVQPLDTIGRMLRGSIDEVTALRVPPGAWSAAVPFDVAELEDAIRWESPAIESGATSVDRHRDWSIADVGPLLERLAARHGQKAVRAVDIRQDEDRVWHMTVTVDDPSARDTTFLQLARGAMELSAAHGVPIVVDVKIEGDLGK